MHRDESPGRGEVEGRYANTFKVGHNAFEFLIDFGQADPETLQEHFFMRIVTGPAYAKALLGVLQASIDQYEQRFGPIADAAVDNPDAPE